MKKNIALLLALVLSVALCAGALAAFTYTKDYRKDDFHDDIKLIQKQLTELGYLTGKPDGWFGAKTQSAVKRFQLVHALEGTGVADESMQTALFSDEAKTSPTVLMSFDRLKELMSESGKLGVKYDLSDMIVDKNSGTIELNNYVVMHCELLGDDVTEIMLIGKDNVRIPFTMLLMALDKGIDISTMYEALDTMIEEGQRVINGMVIAYQNDDDGTQRLVVTPLESSGSRGK